MDPRVAAGHMLAGRYRLGPLLGQGGMAQVFDGFDTRLARPVAVKLLRAEVAAHPDMRRRFEREARAAARLSHPNVVAVYDSGEDRGLAYLVMERLPGQTLADRIARGPLPPAHVAAIGADVLAALDAAHSLGMVHRDIKPGNILIGADGRAKVADFGIAKSLELAPPAGDPILADLTQTGLVIGTPAYLAPERMLGHPATVQADLYAAGVVLYEALTGHKPGAGPDLAAAGIPPGLARVVQRAMAARQEDRYPTARAMAADLAAAAGGAALPPTEPLRSGTEVMPRPVLPPPPTRVAGAARAGPAPDQRRPRDWRRAAALALAALVVAGIVVAIVLSKSRTPVAPGPTVASTSGTATTTATTKTTTTTTTADPQVAALDQAASQLEASGSPAAVTVGRALQAVTAIPAGAARAAAAQQALDVAAALLDAGGLTPAQYQEAAAPLEAAGASPPTTTTLPSPPTKPGGDGKDQGGPGGHGGH